MNLLAVTARAQRFAESLMVDTCTIRPVTGNVTNPDGTVTPSYGAPVYSGKCKIQRFGRNSKPSHSSTGEHSWTTAPQELNLPITSSGIRPNMHVVIDSSIDPRNVGRVYRVRVDDRKTAQSALRVQVEEVVA
jgi:hypothetical protein